MSKNIVLIGLMGCGKSSVAHNLSNKLKKKYIDTDKLIVETANLSINDIFAKFGEPYFRQIESQIILNVSNREDSIISTGGGIVEKVENISNLKKNGTLFYLKTPVEVLYNRIKKDTERPLLKSENPLEVLQNLLERREKFYEMADFVINTENKNIDEVVNNIISFTGSN